MNMGRSGASVRERKSGAIPVAMVGSGPSLVRAHKLGAAIAIASLVLVSGCSASVPEVDPKVVAPQALLNTSTSISPSRTPATTASSAAVASSSTTPTPTIDTAALAAAAAAAAESERLAAEQAAAAAAAVKAEADRVAAEAAAAAQAESERVAAEAAAAAAAAAQAEADRQAAAQAEADRQAAAQAEADRQAEEQAAAAEARRIAESSSVSYANCAEAKAAGAAPVYKGSPGYSSKLDRDGDGVGCES